MLALPLHYLRALFSLWRVMHCACYRFAFGAFAILDGGLELTTEGMTSWVLIGFLGVWGLLLYGAANNEDD